MKITKSQLRTIIKEEYNALLNEGKYRYVRPKAGEPGDFGGSRETLPPERKLRSTYYIEAVRKPFLDALEKFNPKLRNKFGFQIISYAPDNVSQETADKLNAFKNDPNEENLNTALNALNIIMENKMKITKTQLKTIIKEEYDVMVREVEQRSAEDAVTPEDGKYYAFKRGNYTDYGKYVQNKGFIRVQHEQFYKKYAVTPYYDQGTIIREITPEEAAKHAADKIAQEERETYNMGKFGG